MTSIYDRPIDTTSDASLLDALIALVLNLVTE